MADEYVYLSNDNNIIVELTENGSNITQAQYEAISRMTLDFAGSVVDSDITGEGVDQSFDWTGDRRLVIALGTLTIIPGYYAKVKHVVYSPDNLNGIVWGYLNILVT